MKECRLKWARMKLKNLSEEKESTRTLTNTKLDIVVYLPFAVIVKRKGGRDEESGRYEVKKRGQPRAEAIQV